MIMRALTVLNVSIMKAYTLSVACEHNRLLSLASAGGDESRLYSHSGGKTLTFNVIKEMKSECKYLVNL